MTQLESTNTKTENYCYRLEIFGYGGECKIGTIDGDIAPFWQEKGNEFFRDYILSRREEREELNKEYSIPEKCQNLPEDWYDLEDIQSLHGPAFIENDSFINIINNDTDDEILETAITESMLVIEDEVDELLHNRVPVFAVGREKGNWIFELETKKPFDISKLKVLATPWNEELIISKFEYEGETIFQSYSETESKETDVGFY